GTDHKLLERWTATWLALICRGLRPTLDSTGRAPRRAYSARRAHSARARAAPPCGVQATVKSLPRAGPRPPPTANACDSVAAAVPRRVADSRRQPGHRRTASGPTRPLGFARRTGGRGRQG